MSETVIGAEGGIGEFQVNRIATTRLTMLVSAIKSSNAAQNNLKDMMKAMERDCTIHRSHLQAAIAERDDRDVKLMHLKAELGTEDFRTGSGQ
jgi:N-acetyl-gamma-glutamylphosphate reductase